MRGALPVASAQPPVNPDGIPDGDWHAYIRSHLGNRWSPLTQITPQNVAGLEVAWAYNTRDLRRDSDPTETTFQVTPLKIGRTLYLCTQRGVVIALEAATGK